MKGQIEWPELDYRLGRALHGMAQRSKGLRIFAEIVSLTADECVWLAISAVVISLGFAYQLFAAPMIGWRSHTCAEDILCDVFGTCCVSACLEITGKFACRRARPPYSKPGEYNLPGEVYSMPSGHVLRTAILASWLAHNGHASLLFPSLGSLLMSPGAASLWIGSVALSRVLKGKHFPLDTVIGAAIGTAVGTLLENPESTLDAESRGWIKVISGTFITSLWGPNVFVPECQRRLDLPRSVCMLTYYAFYLAFLFARVPKTAEGWWPGACAL